MIVMVNEVLNDFSGACPDIVGYISRGRMRSVVIIDDLVKGLTVIWTSGGVYIPELMVGGCYFPEIFRVLFFSVVKFGLYDKWLDKAYSNLCRAFYLDGPVVAK